MWIDGICHKCGGIVLETSADDSNEYDYKNICTNPKCEENKWHYVADLDELDYYYHNPRLNENEKFLSLLKTLAIELNKED